jgi:hypothetical protein
MTTFWEQVYPLALNEYGHLDLPLEINSMESYRTFLKACNTERKFLHFLLQYLISIPNVRLDKCQMILTQIAKHLYFYHQDEGEEFLLVAEMFIMTCTFAKHLVKRDMLKNHGVWFHCHSSSDDDDE